jgi:hypothetical protein
MNELDVQGLIVKDCKEQGGYAIKLSNRFVAGVPDLLLAMPMVGSAFAEVKLLKGESTVVLVTSLQVLTIKKMQKAGIHAGIMAVRSLGEGNYALYIACLMDEDIFRIRGYKQLTRRKGEPWPIGDVIRLLMRPSVA